MGDGQHIPIDASKHLALAAWVAGEFRERARCRGIAFEDVVSEAYVGLCRAAKVYDPARGCSFTALAVKVMRNTLIKYMGRWKPLRQAPVSAKGEWLVEPAARPEPDDGQAEALEQLLRRLPAKERYIVERHYGLGEAGPATLAEVALDLGISQQWAWALLDRALKRLRRLAGPENNYF